MTDISMLPTTDEVEQVVQTSPVRTNRMTIAQKRMAHTVWQAIQLARQDTGIIRSELHDLEERFDSLVGELNRACNRITHNTKGGMKFLYVHCKEVWNYLGYPTIVGSRVITRSRVIVRDAHICV